MNCILYKVCSFKYSSLAYISQIFITTK